jgi:hypothetical protein
LNIETFIHTTNHISDPDVLTSCVTETIAGYGYKQIIFFSDFGPEYDRGNLTHKQEFIEYYAARNLKAADPVLHLFYNQNIPFTLKQINVAELAPTQQDAMAWHHKSGMRYGYNIPTGTLSTKWVGVTLGSDTAAREDEIALLELYAIVNQYILRQAQLCKEHPQTAKTMQTFIRMPMRFRIKQ